MEQKVLSISGGLIHVCTYVFDGGQVFSVADLRVDNFHHGLAVFSRPVAVDLMRRGSRTFLLRIPVATTLAVAVAIFVVVVVSAQSRRQKIPDARVVFDAIAANGFGAAVPLRCRVTVDANDFCRLLRSGEMKRTITGDRYVGFLTVEY